MGKRRRKKRNTRKYMILGVFGGILLLLAIGVYWIWDLKYGPSDEKMDLSLYFNLDQEEDLAVIVNQQVLEEKGVILDGRAYVSTNVVHDHINSRFYWDSAENKYIYTLPTSTITVEVGNNEYMVDKEKVTTDYQIVKVNSDIAYVALDFIQLYTGMEYTMESDPNRVVILSEYGEKEVVSVKKGTEVRYRAGVKSPILTKVSKGEQLFVLKEEQEIKDWTKVCTSDGYVGYVQNKRLGKKTVKNFETDFTEPVYDHISKDYKINLVWHQVTNQAANDTIYTKLKDTKGVTTISPTWFYIRDNSGSITSLASQAYVDYCHQNGVEVWGLVENMTYKNDFDITEVLNRTSSRQNLVSQLIAQAIQYGLDGINVDIEGLPSEAGEGYIQFIRELSIMCRRNHIILSVDNYVPSAYTAVYDRKEQGIVADYVIIMGYDEHYAGGGEVGSVASIGFVQKGIEDTLKEVPAEKVINAVPFYTRLWCTDAAGEVTSQVFGMDGADEMLKTNGAEKNWSEECKQYYAEFDNQEGHYQIWLEEETSIEEKVKFIKEYGLAGVASWKLGYERDEIWDIILKYVN